MAAVGTSSVAPRAHARLPRAAVTVGRQPPWQVLVQERVAVCRRFVCLYLGWRNTSLLETTGRVEIRACGGPCAADPLRRCAPALVVHRPHIQPPADRAAPTSTPTTFRLVPLLLD
jgi:hypothetical protein